MAKLNREFTIGNILTTISIVFGIATFFYSEYQKRLQVDRAYAAEIRGTLGAALGETNLLDAELELFFLEVKPLYVAASEIVVEGEDRATAIQKARDFLWRDISELRVSMERRVLEATSQNAALAKVRLGVQEKFDAFRQEHKDLRAEAVETLLIEAQKTLRLSGIAAEFSAEIGNALRNTHDLEKEHFAERSALMREETAAYLGKVAAEWQE